MTDAIVRPMRAEDLEAFAEITATSYYEVDARTYQRAWPDPVRRPAARNGHWIRRTGQALVTDPGGCWVAEVDGEVVGGAVSRVRELMWILASFAVRPDQQGRGIGTQLMAAAMHHGRGCLRGMFAASADPGAVRRYRLAGFDLHPQMLLTGVVDRSAIPVVDRVREGNAADVDLLNSVDRQTRGAAHLSDHELLLAQFRLVVTDHTTGSGYAYVDDDGAPTLARGHQPAYGVGADVGGPRVVATRAPRCPSTTSPPRTRGRSTSGSRRGWRSTRAATCACGR